MKYHFEEGDKFALKISDDLSETELLDKKRRILEFWANAPDINRDSIFWWEIGGVKELRYVDDYSSIHLTTDTLEFVSYLGTLELRSYYKSDFHGYLVKRDIDELMVQVSTLDCRMTKDGFEQILAAFE